jgi:hypothetical protein
MKMEQKPRDIESCTQELWVKFIAWRDLANTCKYQPTFLELGPDPVDLSGKVIKRINRHPVVLAADEFEVALYRLPLEIITLDMDILLDPDLSMNDEEYYILQLKKFGATVSGYAVSSFRVLVPRDTPMEDLRAGGSGTLRRERIGHVGINRCIEIEHQKGWVDPKTGYNGRLEITPYQIYLSPCAGKFHFFPRQVTAIRLTSDIPSYLSENDREMVRDFYQALRRGTTTD